MSRKAPYQFPSVLCRAILACAMLACAGGVCELEAEEPASIRRLTLPLEQLNRALTPDWQTLTRTELERLLESQTLAPDGPRNSTIVQAEYTATITDDRIHSGKLSADIQHPDSRAALLVLDPLNLTMTGIRWQAAGPAAWGSTPIIGVRNRPGAMVATRIP